MISIHSVSLSGVHLFQYIHETYCTSILCYFDTCLCGCIMFFFSFWSQFIDSSKVPGCFCHCKHTMVCLATSPKKFNFLFLVPLPPFSHPAGILFLPFYIFVLTVNNNNQRTFLPWVGMTGILNCMQFRSDINF